MEWMTRTALEIMGQGGLGYSFDPLSEAKRNIFGDALKALVYVTRSLSRCYVTRTHYEPGQSISHCSLCA